jgi:DNA-directed RNA polymerase subunit RPC12/RpoP
MATVSKISFKTVYKCRECGATSYQPVVDRAHNGALLPTGQYRCTGCRNVFDSLKSWWTPRATEDETQHSRKQA